MIDARRLLLKDAGVGLAFRQRSLGGDAGLEMVSKPMRFNR